MEIRYERVDALELVSGINKNLCPSALRSKTVSSLTIRFSGGFDGPAACRSDADDPSSVFLCFVNDICRFFCDLIPFGMHVMVKDIVFFYGSECTETYM